MKQLQKDITADQIIKAGYPVFVEHTPVKSGNAKRHTFKDATSIHADYAYAKRLDNGWSKQSPGGMTKPAIVAMRDYVQKVIGR